MNELFAPLMALPSPLVFSLIAIVFYLALVARRLERVGYNVAEHIVELEGTGVSKSAMGGLRKQITPKWVSPMVWICSFLAVGFMVYIGFRYGVLWAALYAIGDHIVKKLDPPIFPSVPSSYDMVTKEAEKNASTKIHNAIQAYKPNYQHLE